MNPKFIVEQKITPFVNQYRVYATSAGKGERRLVAFAQQKRVALKEKITFYADEQKTTALFTLRAEKTLDVHGRYLVEDMNGQLLGAFKKDFSKSLIASTWHILVNDIPALKVAESNHFLAVARRYAGFIPFVGEFVDLLTMFFRYHFVISDMDGRDVGMYRKTTLFYDHYQLALEDATYNAYDWRLWAAVAVALDALQSR